MKASTLYETQLLYIQKTMKVSREYVIETCKLTRVSIVRLAEFLQNKERTPVNFSVRL